MAFESPIETRDSSSDHDLEKRGSNVEELENHDGGATLSPTEEDGKLNFATIMAVVALMGQFNCYIMTLLIPWKKDMSIICVNRTRDMSRTIASLMRKSGISF